MTISLWNTYSALENWYGGFSILGVKEEKHGRWEKTGLKNVFSLCKDFWNVTDNPKKRNISLLLEDDVGAYEVSKDVIMVIYVPMNKARTKFCALTNEPFCNTLNDTKNYFGGGS